MIKEEEKKVSGKSQKSSFLDGSATKRGGGKSLPLRRRKLF